MPRRSLTLTIIELPEGGFNICHGSIDELFPLRSAETVQTLGMMVRDKIMEVFAEERAEVEDMPMPAFLDAKEARQGLFMRLIKGGK